MRQILNKKQSELTGPDTSRFWLTVIIIIAILVRVAVALYLGDIVVTLPGTSDQLSYDMLAQRVLGGHGFTVAQNWWPATDAGQPTAHWSYLYTLYLAGVYGLFGYHPIIARLIQSILAGFLMPWLAYRLGHRHFNPTVGLVAAGLAAIYIYFVYYAAALMTETFYILGVLWVLDLSGHLGLVSTEAQNTRMKAQWLWFGCALAITVLLRQVFLLFVPFLFAWLLWRSFRYQTTSILKMIGILFGASMILIFSIAPWTYRNYQAFGQFVLLNTNAGFAFFWGNHPIHGYNFISILPPDGPSYFDLIPPELLDLNEAGLDRALLSRGLGFIQAEPVRYIILSLSRFKDYFKFWPSPGSSAISNLSRLLSFGLLWPFMVYGLIYSLRRPVSSTTFILYLFMITYTVIHLLTWTLIRYRLPVDGVLLVFAAAAIVDLQAKLAQRQWQPRKISKPAPIEMRE